MTEFDLVAYCGIRCSTCPVYIATVNNDHELMAKTAREWSESSGVPHYVEEMHCRGCKSDDLFRWCKECGVRECSHEKERETCGHCPTYGTCGTIRDFLNHSPKEKAYLDAIHHASASRQEQWSIRTSR